eukprot:m.167057 g.167057  ORF g.167057 m.167057 type:complete len:103 (+) comp17763_c0_seq1:111-419(+)
MVFAVLLLEVGEAPPSQLDEGATIPQALFSQFYDGDALVKGSDPRAARKQAANLVASRLASESHFCVQASGRVAPSPTLAGGDERMGHASALGMTACFRQQS